MVKTGSVVFSVPSVTVMVMGSVVPGPAGTPLMPPVLALNLSQEGRVLTLNVSVSSFSSAAMGVKP